MNTHQKPYYQAETWYIDRNGDKDGDTRRFRTFTEAKDWLDDQPGVCLAKEVSYHPATGGSYQVWPDNRETWEQFEARLAYGRKCLIEEESDPDRKAYLIRLDMFASAASRITSIPTGPSGKLVESALHMANASLARSIADKGAA